MLLRATKRGYEFQKTDFRWDRLRENSGSRLETRRAVKWEALTNSDLLASQLILPRASPAYDAYPLYLGCNCFNANLVCIDIADPLEARRALSVLSTLNELQRPPEHANTIVVAVSRDSKTPLDEIQRQAAALARSVGSFSFIKAFVGLHVRSGEMQPPLATLLADLLVELQGKVDTLLHAAHRTVHLVLQHLSHTEQVMSWRRLTRIAVSAGMQVLSLQWSEGARRTATLSSALLPTVRVLHMWGSLPVVTPGAGSFAATLRCMPVELADDPALLPRAVLSAAALDALAHALSSCDTPTGLLQANALEKMCMHMKPRHVQLFVSIFTSTGVLVPVACVDKAHLPMLKTEIRSQACKAIGFVGVSPQVSGTNVLPPEFAAHEDPLFFAPATLPARGRVGLAPLIAAIPASDDLMCHLAYTTSLCSHVFSYLTARVLSIYVGLCSVAPKSHSPPLHDGPFWSLWGGLRLCVWQRTLLLRRHSEVVLVRRSGVNDLVILGPRTLEGAPVSLVRAVMQQLELTLEMDCPRVTVRRYVPCRCAHGAADLFADGDAVLPRHMFPLEDVARAVFFGTPPLTCPHLAKDEPGDVLDVSPTVRALSPNISPPTQQRTGLSPSAPSLCLADSVTGASLCPRSLCPLLACTDLAVLPTDIFKAMLSGPHFPQGAFSEVVTARVCATSTSSIKRTRKFGELGSGQRIGISTPFYGLRASVLVNANATTSAAGGGIATSSQPNTPREVAEGRDIDSAVLLPHGLNVVLKRLSGVAHADMVIEDVLDFLREVCVHVSVSAHPAIVQLHGVTLSPVQLVMEMAHHADLFSFMHPHTRTSSSAPSPTPAGAPTLAPPPSPPSLAQSAFPWPLRLRILRDVARGLTHLHQHMPSVIHRDIRSPNILLFSLDDGATACAKIADFGLAREGVVLSGALDTWRWCAPEVIGSNTAATRYTSAVDIFSLGIIAWEVCALAVPYDHAYTQERFMATSKAGVPYLDVLAVKAAIVEGELRPCCGPALAELRAGNAPLHAAVVSMLGLCWQDAAARLNSTEVSSLLDELGRLL